MKLINIPKVTFVDMDGTLIATKFKDGDRYRMGFNLDEWRKYTTAHGIDSYKDCDLVTPVVDYARELMYRGSKIIVLTVALTLEERSAKVEFLKRTNVTDVFSSAIFLNEPPKKAPYICKYAKEHGLAPSDCLIIEDTFSTCVACMDLGIRVTHVANIIADNVAD